MHTGDYQWLPKRILKWGGARTRKIFCRAPRPTFLALQVQLVVSMSVFLMVSTVSSVYCLLFYSRCTPCPAIC